MVVAQPLTQHERLTPSRTSVITTVAAIVVIGLITVVTIWLLSRDTDEQVAERPETSALPGPSPSGPGTMEVPATLATTVAPTVAPTVVTTVAPTVPPGPAPTTVATTVAATVAPSTVLTGPSPESALGAPQFMNDPLPSGVTLEAVAPAFAVAQQLADALATGDWEAARRLDPDLAGLSDQAFAAGYGGLDRASLMLLDAQPRRDSYRLLFVSVANEKQWSQTSLYCLEWSSGSASATIDQHAGVVGLLWRGPATMSPEAVRADPALDDLIRTECHWS